MSKNNDFEIRFGVKGEKWLFFPNMESMDGASGIILQEIESYFRNNSRIGTNYYNLSKLNIEYCKICEIFNL